MLILVLVKMNLWCKVFHTDLRRFDLFSTYRSAVLFSAKFAGEFLYTPPILLIKSQEEFYSQEKFPYQFTLTSCSCSEENRRTPFSSVTVNL